MTNEQTEIIAKIERALKQHGLEIRITPRTGNPLGWPKPAENALAFTGFFGNLGFVAEITNAAEKPIGAIAKKKRS